MTPIEPLRVLIADDHAEFRAGLRGLLQHLPDIEVIGEAASGEETVVSAARLQPDLIVMDLNMPGIGGIEATRTITRTSPHIAILVLTMFHDDDSVFAAVRAGARGYLLKGARREEIARSVQAVANGEAIFGPGIAQRIAGYFAATPAAEPAFPELTDRERQVLACIAAGDSNPTIAHRLQMSPKTVRNHVSNIFAKLHVADRAQAIIRARDAGLG